MSEDNERLNLGTLLLIDSFQRAGTGIRAVGDEIKVMGTGFEQLMRVVIKVGDALYKQGEKIRQFGMQTDAMNQGWYNVTGALGSVNSTAGGLSAALDAAGAEADVFSNMLLEIVPAVKTIRDIKKEYDLEKELLKRYTNSNLSYADEMATLHKGRLDAAAKQLAEMGAPATTGDKIKKFGTDLGKAGDEALGGIKGGIVAPLKAIPMQIGALLVRPLTRLMDPFMNVLEDLQLFTEPVVGLFEIFAAPLQEVIGIISGEFADALLGNEAMLSDVTDIGTQLASSLTGLWTAAKPLTDVLIPLTPLFLQLGTLLYFVAQPLQALLAIIGFLTGRRQDGSQSPGPVSEEFGADYMPGERERRRREEEEGSGRTFDGGGTTVNNIYLSGNVTTDRQVARGMQELMR